MKTESIDVKHSRISGIHGWLWKCMSLLRWYGITFYCSIIKFSITAHS